jgi:hypothetical protein
MKNLEDAKLLAKRLTEKTGISHYVIQCKSGAYDIIDEGILFNRRKNGEKIITLAEFKGSQR